MMLKPDEFLRLHGATGQYVFADAPDLVVIGRCSDGFSAGYGPSTVRDRRPNPAFFAPILEMKPKKVILLSECCGPYCPAFQDALREMYPETTWVVPMVQDFCVDLLSDQVIPDLVKLGVLQEVSK